MMRQYELAERVRAYDEGADEALLNRAYVFAMKAHGSQRRASGDPYFSHPLEVAGICTELKLDLPTVVTALLHDTIEDTDTSYDDIRKIFGEEIAQLVDGVTKLSKLELQSERTKDAENFRKFVLAMSDDVRVLLVKLADRLHNMRTLTHIPSAPKRQRIAQETMDIYAPLAGRMGMHELREELEDLAFQELNPDARDSIVKRQEFLAAQSGGRVQRVTDEIKRVLTGANVESWVRGRQKRPYSIWRKMHEKSISFEQLSDIMGFRVVVGSVADCYKALGVLHTTWRTVPGRFKDYISLKKPNGYQSLHTTIVGPDNARIEVQIRTVDMNEIAERGVAAHWAYKDHVGLEDKHSPYAFLQQLGEMAREGETLEDVIENTKLELFQDQVFCFTPKGALIALPKGATPIDFAYAVHTDLGNQCVGARINGRPSPLRTRLSNGDEVEIVRSKSQTPQPAWEAMVVTGKARSAIRRHIRNAHRAEIVKIGRRIAEKAFLEADQELTDKGVEEAIKRLKFSKPDDLYAAVGQGQLALKDVVGAVFPESVADGASRRKANGKGHKLIPIRGLTAGIGYRLGECCHPVPGDRIVGLMEPGKGITVHTIDCDSLEPFHEQPDLWLDLGWETFAKETAQSTARLVVDLANEPGALAALCTVIAKAGGNISNLKIVERGPSFFQFQVDIEVRDVKHVTNIMTALHASPSVSTVERARG
ncbi:MAG: bifunctional (p)ppGpp synthetase/guanosine-3',5'-bis(diphosphate) 3'-pyrophosphohydrolase [Alphaproteobacteria bacterium]|nr:bifunctional (p)ppGpp synthetase/guanosine-3',5'-bis(diphosphate) 3'-pyrophosphohydrolase [Alphaproteobacteria bacterium]